MKKPNEMSHIELVNVMEEIDAQMQLLLSKYMEYKDELFRRFPTLDEEVFKPTIIKNEDAKNRTR